MHTSYARSPIFAPTGAAAVPAATQLEPLVSGIALYPDDLVSIILPAATNPLQLVQADRFLDKRKSDPQAPVDEKWDDAVKSLLNYPEVVKSMSADLDWTSQLGEAVVADQGAVLDAVQTFRRKTQAVGNLKSDQKQTVVVEKEIIKISKFFSHILRHEPERVGLKLNETGWVSVDEFLRAVNAIGVYR